MIFFWQCQSPGQTGDLKGCGFFRILDMKAEGAGRASETCRPSRSAEAAKQHVAHRLWSQRGIKSDLALYPQSVLAVHVHAVVMIWLIVFGVVLWNVAILHVPSVSNIVFVCKFCCALLHVVLLFFLVVIELVVLLVPVLEGFQPVFEVFSALFLRAPLLFFSQSLLLRTPLCLLCSTLGFAPIRF